MNIADLNEIIQSGTKSNRDKEYEEARKREEAQSNRQLISTKMEDLRTHIKELESKLDHTKHLIRTANKVTSEISERKQNNLIQNDHAHHKRGDSQKVSENVLLSARRAHENNNRGSQTARQSV